MFGTAQLTTPGVQTASRDAAKCSVQSGWKSMLVREGSNVVFVWWRQFGGEHNSGSAGLNYSIFGSSIVDFLDLDSNS